MRTYLTVLGIAAMAFLFGCEKQEPQAEPPVVEIEECKAVSADGETVTLAVKITNPVKDGIANTKITPDCDWIVSPVLGEDALTFDVLKYETDEEAPEDRSASIKVEYPGAEPVNVEVVQSAPKPEGPDDPDEPVDPEKPELTFTLSISSARVTKAVVGCEPSDAEATYVLRIITQEEYANYMSMDAIIEADIEDFEADGGIAAHLKSGTVSGMEVVTEPGTDYYLMAYGLDADGTVTSDGISTEAFSSLPRPVVSLEWDAETVIPAEGGDYEILYSVENPLAGIDGLGAVASEDWIEFKSGTDGKLSFSVDPNDSEQQRTATLSFSYEDSEPITPIVITQDGKTSVSGGLTFEISNISTTSSSVTFDIVPSDENATYYRGVMSKSEFDEYGSDENVIAADIEYFQAEDWFGVPGEIADYLYSGSQANCYEYLTSADTDYYIYAYGLNADGTVTSDGITKVLIHSNAKPELVILDWDNETVIPIEGGTYKVSYELKNPIEGRELTANAGYQCSDWVTDVSVDMEECIIEFTVLPSTDVAPSYETTRSGFVTLSYYDLAYSPNIMFEQQLPE